MHLCCTRGPSFFSPEERAHFCAGVCMLTPEVAGCSARIASHTTSLERLLRVGLISLGLGMYRNG
jgi:hypothetical protein